MTAPLNTHALTPKGDETRRRILATARELLHVKGYANTSINDVIDATGVKKGNLYYYFSSKDELIRGLLEESRREYMAYLNNCVRGATPVERINDILDAIYQFHRSRDFLGGCIFGNLALETADTNAMMGTILRQVFDEWIALLSRHLADARDAGQIRSDLDPGRTARHIVALLEGAVMMAKLTKDERQMADCIESFRQLLGIAPGVERR